MKSSFGNSFFIQMSEKIVLRNTCTPKSILKFPLQIDIIYIMLDFDEDQSIRRIL